MPHKRHKAKHLAKERTHQGYSLDGREEDDTFKKEYDAQGAAIVSPRTMLSHVEKGGYTR